MDQTEPEIKELDLSEVEFAKMSVDACGRIFRWRGRIFRGIYADMVPEVLGLFSCGLVEALVAEKLLPQTWVTQFQLAGYGLVLEHRKVDNISYPFEWSFAMLREAAVTVLRVNLAARKFGYETKDCHPYNICFDHATPLFVDLGSFIKVADTNGWACYDEFLTSYLYPLRLWSKGNSYLARRSLFSLSLTDAMTCENYLLYRYPPLRALHPDHLRRGVSLVLALKKRLALNPFNLEKLLDKTAGIRIRSSGSAWGDYHDAYHDPNGEPLPSRRFVRIMELIDSYQIRSVVELGGNQGVFSELLLKRSKVSKVVCTDCDENAVDAMYENAKDKGLPLTAALLDIMYPLMTYYEPPPYLRFCSDAVVVLAVVHHLVLGRKLPLELFFEIVSKYSARYVFIEFMPLGLWNGTVAPPLPVWYTQDWFRTEFEKFFKLRHVEELEENRVLFVGEIGSNRDAE
ncbi:class I SAM-dependent methyltransferase [Citrifermentans bremense]|uniref:class I SAM-dependent methyltransferase n=1 Tax=Citrifermentans bremense TaxID=60035 RepID=UPI0003FB5271|nr:class I SAM-dependent methyltransferase [Citrifermentans bremense]